MSGARYRPGDLDQQVTVLARCDVPDGAGGSKTAWPVIDKAPAQVTPVSGGVSAETGQLVDKITYRIVVRPRQLAVDRHRLVWRGRVLAIKSAPPAGRALYQVVTAEEISG